MLDCGELTVNFFYDDGLKTPLDPAFLFDDRSHPVTETFSTMYSEDLSLVGDHTIKYEVFYTDYPMAGGPESEPFTVTVIDPCDEPVSMAAPVDPLTD